MSLFKQILNAIDDPQKEANPNQLSSILNTIDTLSNYYNANPTMIKSAMSVIGKYTKTALQEKRQEEGEEKVEQLISQFGGTNANSQIVQMLFSTPQLQNLLGEAENKTGLSKNTIGQILPILLPLVLNFLKTGNNSGQSFGGNKVLSSFLDPDGDGDFDIADAISFAGKYLS